jgi:hypothetical protein
MALFGNPVALAARVAIVALSPLLRNFSIFGILVSQLGPKEEQFLMQEGNLG